MQVGQKYTKPKKTIDRFKNSDNEPLLEDQRFTVKKPSRVSQSDDPMVNVNRTNKADFRASVAHKNQRHDPVPRLQGSDDSRALQHVMNPRRRKQRI